MTPSLKLLDFSSAAVPLRDCTREPSGVSMAAGARRTAAGDDDDDSSLLASVITAIGVSVPSSLLLLASMVGTGGGASLPLLLLLPPLDCARSMLCTRVLPELSLRLSRPCVRLRCTAFSVRSTCETDGPLLELEPV